MKEPISKTTQHQDDCLVVLNVAEALERMGNDEEVYREIAHYFADNLPKSLQSLRQALDRNQVDEARRFAHSLKSNCATVGAEELRAQCYELEALCRGEDLAEARRLYALLVPRLMFLRDRLLAL